MKLKDVVYEKASRKDFAKVGDYIEMPNLIKVQKDSYDWFVEEGLGEVLKDISPIEDYSGNLVLEFFDYYMEEKTKYTLEEAKERDATYATRLHVKVRLINRETGEIKEQEIYLGDFPLMTNSGTFVINGAERVVVSQLVRSPGCYYAEEFDTKTGKRTYTSTVMPLRGAWIEYETDGNDIFYVRVDRTRKLPVTSLLRAIGIISDDQIRELFGDEELLTATIAKDTIKTQEEALIEIYKKLRPGELPTVEAARSLFNGLFFDNRRYDLAKVGRYKFNKKLALAYRIMNRVAYDDIINPETGEVFVKADEKISYDDAWKIQNSGINAVTIKTDEDRKVKVIGNNFVDIKAHIDFDIDDLNIKEKSLTHIIKNYSKFFNNKERYSAFKKLDIDNYTEENIHIAVLSVLCKLSVLDFEEVTKVLLREFLNKDKRYLENIKKFGDIDAFWELCSKYYGYNLEEKSIGKLMILLAITDLDEKIDKQLPKSYTEYISDKKSNCSIFHFEEGHHPCWNLCYPTAPSACSGRPCPASCRRASP